MRPTRDEGHRADSDRDEILTELDSLRAERDALQAERAGADALLCRLLIRAERAERELLVLRTALVKWKHGVIHDCDVGDTPLMQCDEELLALIPDDNWKIEL